MKIFNFEIQSGKSIRLLIFLFFILIFFVFLHNFYENNSPQREQASIRGWTLEEYYQLGFSNAKSIDESSKHLVLFEKEINSLYKELSSDIQRHFLNRSLSLWDEIYLRAIVSNASGSLFNIERKFLLASGVSEDQISQDFLGNFSHSSSGIIVLPAERFLSFLHGVSDATGYYITAFPEKKEFKGALPVTFPKFCFADHVGQQQSVLPEDIRKFLKSDFFLSTAARELYRLDKSSYIKMMIENSREYSMTEIRPSCGLYGEVDKRRLEEKIVLFPDVIKKESYLKKHPELTSDFLKEIEIHEIMHYLTKNSCDKIGLQEINDNNILITKRRINEALASIGTIAVFSSNKQKNKEQVLLNGFYFSREKNYGMTFDLFFSTVFLKISQRKINEMQKKSADGVDLTSKDLPPYMKIADSGTDNVIGKLNIGGEAKYISVPLEYDNFRLQYDLLLEASNSDILSATTTGFEKLSSMQKTFCSE